MEAKSGHDFRTARRSLLLEMKRWANRGRNFWQLEEYALNLVAGTATYAMPTNTIDLVFASIQQGTGNEVNISPPISAQGYHNLPNKTLPGKPVNYFVLRKQNNPTIYLWPVPNSSDYTLRGWRCREDGVAAANDQSLEVPSRFEPAIVAALASALALKKVDDPQRRAEMDKRAKELWLEAERADSTGASIRFMPEVAW